MKSLDASLAGALVAAAAYWQTGQDQIRRARQEARETREALQDFFYRGEFLRLRSPSVQDFLLGLLYAAPPPEARRVVPSYSRPQRPEVPYQFGGWPLKGGTYNGLGLVQEAGPLATLGLGLTFDEARAFLLGLIQPRPPTEEQAQQFWNATQALGRVLSELRLPLEAYARAWRRLFSEPDPTTPAAGLPLVHLRGKGATSDAQPLPLASFRASADGIYKATALCGLQRGDGMGGNVAILASFSRSQGVLSLIRSDRLLAQLPKALVGVDATFEAVADSIQLTVTGRAMTALTWDSHITVFVPS